MLAETPAVAVPRSGHGLGAHGDLVDVADLPAGVVRMGAREKPKTWWSPGPEFLKIRHAADTAQEREPEGAGIAGFEAGLAAPLIEPH